MGIGGVEEQRYICRFCSKICVSGKSLGGHMRVHLSQISASKKAAAAAAQERATELCHGDDNGEDGSYSPLQETFMNAEMEDGDQSSSYELRENPKKSWRISDPKHGLINNSNSCKECGKEFVSLRALSGHMRCHSIKNKKEVHHCNECGRGFDSIRAMFGHMKSHSKRVKKVPSLAVESSESLSDLENFCPIRRKRSRIRYNPSFLGVDASDSAVSELEEAEEAARCLVMLSRGVRSCLRLDSSNVESDDDDSAYFGGVTACRSKRFCGNGGGLVKEFDEHDLKLLVDEDQIELDVVFGSGMKKVELVCDDEFLKSGFGNNEFDESGFENEDGLENLEKKPKHKQRVQNTSSNLCRNGSLLSVDEADSCNGEDDQLVREIGSVVSLTLESSKSKKRECPICFKVFSSGQALGGHKRAHYNGVVESKNREAAEEDRGILDLNLSISGDVGLDSWFVERKHEALMLTT